MTSLLAVGMRRKGHNVGILDADITGPSIPKVFGGDNYRADTGEFGIYPARTHNDIKIMSINLLLEKNDAPVIWRGPLIAGAVKQFWTDVIWGNLDYLFFDMPPGTGDVPLTVFQSVPLDGLYCDFTTGPCFSYSQEGLQHGKDHEYSYSWNH